LLLYWWLYQLELTEPQVSRLPPQLSWLVALSRPLSLLEHLVRLAPREQMEPTALLEPMDLLVLVHLVQPAWQLLQLKN
jgi:hypothetical protein